MVYQTKWVCVRSRAPVVVTTILPTAKIVCCVKSLKKKKGRKKERKKTRISVIMVYFDSFQIIVMTCSLECIFPPREVELVCTRAKQRGCQHHHRVNKTGRQHLLLTEDQYPHFIVAKNWTALRNKFSAKEKVWCKKTFFFKDFGPRPHGSEPNVDHMAPASGS